MSPEEVVMLSAAYIINHKQFLIICWIQVMYLFDVLLGFDGSIQTFANWVQNVIKIDLTINKKKNIA